MQNNKHPNSISSSLFSDSTSELTTVDIAKEIQKKRNILRMRILYIAVPVIVILGAVFYYTVCRPRPVAEEEVQKHPEVPIEAKSVPDHVFPLIFHLKSQMGLEMLQGGVGDIIKQAIKAKPSEIHIEETMFAEGEKTVSTLTINGETFANLENTEALAAFINRKYKEAFPHSIVPLNVKLKDEIAERMKKAEEDERLREESIRTNTILQPASPDSPGWSLKSDISLPDVN